MGKLTFRSGSVTVRMNDELTGKLDKAIRSLIPETVHTIESEVEKVYQNAHARWPDKGDDLAPRATGRSKAALEREVTVDLGTGHIRGVIRNNARRGGYLYAYKIKSLKFVRETRGTTWSYLVVRPLRKIAKKLPAKLSDELGPLLRRKAA